GQLSPALRVGDAAPGSRPDVGRRRRAGPDRDSRVADRRLARARGLGHDGDPDRGPPEPQADPHGRRLGGAPAAEGLPDRRRAGPLLGGGVSGYQGNVRRPPAPDHPPTSPWYPLMTVAPERTRAAIYEGTRIPHPIPTVLRVPGEIAATGDVLPINFGP